MGNRSPSTPTVRSVGSRPECLLQVRRHSHWHNVMKLGTITISGVSLPIMDCKSWRVAGTSPFCVKNLDASKCAICQQRETRNGNYLDPPIMFGEQATVEQPMFGRRPGMGDVVAAATNAAGIKTCGGCARRKAAMNKATPGWVGGILLRSSQLVDTLKARVWKR